MASKRSTPLDDPPSASSDDEETEDDEPEEEEEESESESEEEEQSKSKPQNPIETPKFQNPNSSKPSKSSSEEEEESESESESEEKTPIEPSKTLTPKSSTVFDFDTEDTDVKSPTASGFAIKPSKKVSEKTPTSKRLFQGSDLKENNNNKKKIKVSNGDFVDDEKKSVVKRVWSDNDELLLLQGFIDYQSKKGYSPLSDMEGFYQFTMDSLPGNASKSQLYEKIRRLKKKFRVNSEKTSETGEDPVFQKPHERKLYEVSKRIWGSDGCETLGALNASNVKSSVKSRSKSKSKPKAEVKEEMEEEELEEDYEENDVKLVDKVEDFETLYPYLSAGLKTDVTSSLNFPSGVVDLVKEKMSVIGEAKARELNGKWKAYFENETVLRKRRIALLSNVAELGASM